jgi:hypothetical protein
MMRWRCVLDDETLIVQLVSSRRTEVTLVVRKKAWDTGRYWGRQICSEDWAAPKTGRS